MPGRMSTDPKRRFWQLHLSTLLLVALLGAGIQYLNWRSTRTFDYWPIPHDPLMTHSVEGPIDYYGWPKTCLVVWGENFKWQWSNLIVNGLAGLSILTAIACSSECIIRRREVRRL